MTVEQALRQILLVNAGVSAIVSGRIFPDFLPQSVTFPAVTYGLRGRQSRPVLSSPTTTPPESIYWIIATSKGSGAASFAEVTLLAEAIRLALEGYKAEVVLIGSSPLESIYIQGIFFRGAETQYFDATQTRQAGGLYAVRHSQQTNLSNP